MSLEAIHIGINVLFLIGFIESYRNKNTRVPGATSLLRAFAFTMLLALNLADGLWLAAFFAVSNTVLCVLHLLYRRTGQPLVTPTPRNRVITPRSQ